MAKSWEPVSPEKTPSQSMPAPTKNKQTNLIADIDIYQIPITTYAINQISKDNLFNWPNWNPADHCVQLINLISAASARYIVALKRLIANALELIEKKNLPNDLTKYFLSDFRVVYETNSDKTKPFYHVSAHLCVYKG